MFFKRFMNDKKNKIKANYTYKSLILTFLIVLLLFLPLGIVLDKQYKKELLSHKREEIKSQLKDYSMLLTRVINDKFSLLKALEVYTKENWDQDIKESEFNQFAYGLYSSNSGIRNLIIAPDGVNKYVYPIKNNKEAVGYNLLKDKRSEVKKAVKETIDSKKPVASGPYQLRQGGEGIILRKAIYKNSNFWGLVTMTLDMNPIYEYVKLKNKNSHINIALKREEKVFFGENNIFEKNPVIITLSYQGGKFDIAGTPNEGWNDSIENDLIIFRMILFGIIFLLAIITYILSYRNFKVQLLVENKTKHLKEMNLLLQEKKEKVREQKEELSASYEQLTAYSKEVMAMNEELEQSFEEINSLNQRFVKMIELVSNMTDESLLNEKDFLEELLNKAIKIIPEANYGSVYIYKKGKVNFINTIGYELSSLKDINIPEEAFFNKDDNIEILDFSEVKRRNKKFMDQNNYNKLKKLSYKMKEIMYMDLEILGQKKAGLSLDISEQSSKNFTNNSLSIFKAFHNIASSFYTIKEYNNLQNSFTKELITAIIKIMEMYDSYTKGHSENVARIASVIAKKMGLSDKEVDNTYWAGLVHDIGKLLIPISILNKKDKLTNEEFELIKEHPVLGSRALESSNSLKPIARYVKSHHERWDGRGYPEGLRENETPLISQIISVADAWDAMLSRRSYRDSLSFEYALKEIKRNKGTQFSPQVVDAFIKIIENDNIKEL